MLLLVNARSPDLRSHCSEPNKKSDVGEVAGVTLLRERDSENCGPIDP